MIGQSKGIMDRRKFLKKLGIATLVVPIGQGLTLTTPVFAEPLPPADEEGSLSISLNYKHDASVSTVRKNSTEFCKNCVLFADNGSEWGGCSIFPVNSVNTNGWCSAWSPK